MPAPKEGRGCFLLAGNPVTVGFTLKAVPGAPGGAGAFTALHPHRSFPTPSGQSLPHLPSVLCPGSGLLCLDLEGLTVHETESSADRKAALTRAGPECPRTTSAIAGKSPFSRAMSQQ